jgi:hypothetical protein
MDYELFKLKNKPITTKIVLTPVLIIGLSWKIFGGMALIMYLMGIVSVLAV